MFEAHDYMKSIREHADGSTVFVHDAKDKGSVLPPKKTYFPIAHARAREGGLIHRLSQSGSYTIGEIIPARQVAAPEPAAPEPAAPEPAAPEQSASMSAGNSERLKSLSEDAAIKRIISEYLTYPIPDKVPTEISVLLADKPRTFLYAEVLQSIEKEGKMHGVHVCAARLHAECNALLQSFGITDISLFTNSKTWAYWDIAKNIYDTIHPEKAESKYPIENPLTSRSKQDEIVRRMLAWEIYTGSDSPIAREIQERIGVQFEEGERIPSWRLSELGKLIEELP
jgi:hypothetical protein